MAAHRVERRVQRGAADHVVREMFVGYHRDLRQLPRLRRLLDHVVKALGQPTEGVSDP
jgi:uncharacterized protein (DUF2342 family)